MLVHKSHSTEPSTKPVCVGVVVFEGFAMMSFSAAVEPLRAANRLAESELYRVSFIGGQPSVRSSGGASIDIDQNFGTRKTFDLVLVVAGSDIGGEHLVTYNNAKVFRWLRLVSKQGVLMAGVSGGPAILAKAGLMNNRRMTIHWDHAESLAALMPELLLEKLLYVRDRDRLTCAGGIAPMDMMHAFIGEQHGPEFARRVSDWFLHTDIRGSGEPQKAGVAERYNVHSKPLLAVLELMENHIADPLDLDQLAAVASLSSRQLNRLFQDKLGQSAIAFYRQLRLEKGRSLLLQSGLDINDIAESTGFCDAAHFGRCFRKAFQCRPSDIRAE